MTTAAAGSTYGPPTPAVGLDSGALTDGPDRRSVSDRLMWVSVVVATVPIVAAVIRALSTDWMPVGDNAYFTVRSRDVLTQYHPLVGAWSAGSQAVDVDVNNLGPLQLDLLAPFTKIAPVAGTAIGVGAVHVAVVVGIALTLRRLAGPVVVIVGMALTTGIAWTLGSALLVETRQHNYLVLPFLCFLVLAWAVAAGGGWAMPWMAFSGSLLLQTHLTYAHLVTGLTLWALAGFALHARSVRGESDRDAWLVHRRRLLRQVAITAAVVLIAWIQPIIDQFFGTGNLANVLRTPGSGDGLGWSPAIRLVATVVAVPPWWGRPSFDGLSDFRFSHRSGVFDPEGVLVTTTSAVIGLVVVGALLFGAGWLARRARSQVGVVGAGTAAVAVLLAIVATATIPEGELGFQVGNYRWLWPISAFVVLSIVIAVVLGAELVHAPQRIPRRLRLVSIAALAVTATLAALSIPAADFAGDGEEATRRMPITARLIDQLDDLDVDGPVFYDRGDVFFGEHFTYPVLFKLQELGIEFTVDDYDVARFGTKRRDRGEATHALKFVWGDAAREVPDGAERVAFVAGTFDTDTVGLLLIPT